MLRNARQSSKSYAIFIAAPITSGPYRESPLISVPATAGATAHPPSRTRLVIPANVLPWVHNREHVGLACRDIDLHQSLPQQKERRGDAEARCKGDRHEQQAREDVCENHGVHQADALRQPCRTQVRNRVHRTRAKEQRPKHSLCRTKTLEEKVPTSAADIARSSQRNSGLI
jgi:hypothetical protein